MRWQADPPTIEIEPPQDGFDPLLDRVIVSDDSGPLGRTTQNGEKAESGHFRLPMELAAGVKLPSAGVRAWLVPRDLVRRLRPDWPTGAPLLTTIENVGPGGESAWIRAGELQGVNKGQSWWRRVNGQPMYRLDVRYSGPDVSFCRVLRLAAEVRPAVEDAVALWPGPGEIREGRLSSAVSQIDTTQADPIVWVAKPPQAPCPSDARFDFYRNGRYVGYGVTERGDARFWYARLLAQACAGPLQVGDDAVVRTFADAANARSRGHVFANTQEGWLVTAGETDGVVAGMPAVVLRNGSPIGTVEIRRVQNAYCIVGDLIRPEGAAADSLQRLDEVRFGRPSTVPLRVGVIKRVMPGGLFTAERTSADTPIGEPLAVESQSQQAGVAVLFHAADRVAYGMCVENTLLRPLQAGQELTRSIR